MRDKVISLLKIALVINLFVICNSGNAAYFYRPDVPDYEVVTVPCYEHHYSVKKHHHYHAKHRSVATTHHNRASYSIVKYYVYRSYKGDFIWVPSPCDCNGTLVEVRHLKSTRDFFHEPYRETGYANRDQDGVDYDMDMRTSDDIDNEY